MMNSLSFVVKVFKFKIEIKVKRLFNTEKYKQKALQILDPIKPADQETTAVKDFLFSAKRSNASQTLPEYYLIFFLFSELLNFKNLGRFEKIAWSFPIDFKGKAFLIEHRKFGVGIFIQDEKDQEMAREIAKKISGAVKSIIPFYDYLAEQAVKNSKFNVVNNSQELFERFEFFLKSFKHEHQNYLDNKDKTERIVKRSEYGESIIIKSLDYEFKQKANWLAISCIESFFSWTEHLFIHLAIIDQGLCDGEKISKLIDAEWKVKFQAAIYLKSSKEAENFYNELIVIRNQLRNFVAHGAFGKDGNAFTFHSKAGAVPVLMNHKKKRNKFSFYGHLTFNEKEVVLLIEEFINFLWVGKTGPAMEYIHEYDLPTILTFSANGVYRDACESLEKMREFANKLSNQFDNSANMDW